MKSALTPWRFIVFWPLVEGFTAFLHNQALPMQYFTPFPHQPPNSLSSYPFSTAAPPVSHFRSFQAPAFSLPKASSHRSVQPQLYGLSLQPGSQCWWLYIPFPTLVPSHAIAASPLLNQTSHSAPFLAGGNAAPPLHHLGQQVLSSFLWIPSSRWLHPPFPPPSFFLQVQSLFLWGFLVNHSPSRPLSWPLLAPRHLIS